MNTILCTVCGKEVSAQVRVCPFCNSRLVKESKTQTAEKICPRCERRLVDQEYRGTIISFCEQCSGIWVDNKTFNRLTTERDVYSDESIPYEYVKRVDPESQNYLKCPVCQELMCRRNFMDISGVLIDHCGDHGVWLDKDELSKVRTFIANGGLEEAQSKAIRENAASIEILDDRTSDLEFMSKVLHFWKLKRIRFKGFK